MNVGGKGDIAMIGKVQFPLQAGEQALSTRDPCHHAAKLAEELLPIADQHSFVGWG